MKSNIEWKEWGARDPLYAVATWHGKERGSPDAWTDEEFYELGRSDWADFLKHWQQYGLKAGTCVEIGCGAGRMTKQISGSFEQVVALDVSQHQLDYAKEHLSLHNVTFTLSDGLRLPVGDASCDAAFAVHVFQHFESHADAFTVFRDLHRVLKPGGTLMIHLPLYNLPDMRFSKFFKPLIPFSKRVSDLSAAMGRRQLLKGKWKFVMRKLQFERKETGYALQEIGYTGVEFRTFPVSSNQGYHGFVFATKAG